MQALRLACKAMLETVTIITYCDQGFGADIEMDIVGSNKMGPRAFVEEVVKFLAERTGSQDEKS